MAQQHTNLHDACFVSKGPRRILENGLDALCMSPVFCALLVLWYSFRGGSTKAASKPVSGQLSHVLAGLALLAGVSMDEKLLQGFLRGHPEHGCFSK